MFVFVFLRASKRVFFEQRNKRETAIYCVLLLPASVVVVVVVAVVVGIDVAYVVGVVVNTIH